MYICVYTGVCLYVFVYIYKHFQTPSAQMRRPKRKHDINPAQPHEYICIHTHICINIHVYVRMNMLYRYFYAYTYHITIIPRGWLKEAMEDFLGIYFPTYWGTRQNSMPFLNQGVFGWPLVGERSIWPLAPPRIQMTRHDRCCCGEVSPALTTPESKTS